MKCGSILITGAGSGIGRRTARLFLDEGWRVGLLGRRRDALEESACDSDAALVLPCDVTNPDAIDTAFGEIEREWGRLDVLFNNAGTNVKNQPLNEIPVADWLKVCSVNITGMVLAARAAFGLMRQQDPQGGRIINNGSISAHAPRPGSVPYTVSKHSVTGLTKSLVVDGRNFGIACGQIDIGNALTERTERMSKGVMQADGSIRPEPLMDAGDVARAVLHMASQPAGANIPFLTIMATDMPFIGRG